MIKNVTIDRDISIITNFKYNISENLVTEYLKNPKLILQSKTTNLTPIPQKGFLILPNNFSEMLQNTCAIIISFDVEVKPSATAVVPSNVIFSCEIYSGHLSTSDNKYKLMIETMLPSEPDSSFGLLVGAKDLVNIKNLRIEYDRFRIGTLKPISTTVQFDGIVGSDRLVIEEIQ